MSEDSKGLEVQAQRVKELMGLVEGPNGFMAELPIGSLWKFARDAWEEPQYAIVVSHTGPILFERTDSVPRWQVELLLSADEKVIPWMFIAENIRGKNWQRWLMERIK